MESFNELYKKIIKFRDDREWKKFHTPENLSKSIAIEAGELLENFQWGDTYSKEEVLDELADVLIYSILLADSMESNPLEIIERKLKKNEKRFLIKNVKGNSGKHTKVEVYE